MGNWYEQKRRLIESFYKSLSSDDKIEWAIHRRACDKSSFFFIKEVGGYMPKCGGDVSPIIHKPILDRWQDKSITRQACYMPRSWKKTTCLTLWSSGWEYLQNNEIRILIPSEKEEKAGEWVLWLEGQLLGNERLRWLYPELLAIDPSYTRKTRWSGKKCQLPRAGVYPEATISVIGIRGGAQGGHYDIINPDDMVGERGMESELILQDAERWFDNIEGLLIEKDPLAPDASRVRIVGTHWAMGDQGHYIQQNYPQYKWMIVPCLKDNDLKDTENITWIQHPNAESGESNWPEMFTTEIYREMMGNPEQQMTFYAQYMNNPKKSPMNPLDPKWFKYYRIETRESIRYIVCKDDNEEFRVGSFPLYGFIDPGGFSHKKLTKGSSRFAILHGGQPQGTHKKFITYAKAFRFHEPDKALDEVFMANDFFKPVTPTVWRQEVYGQQAYILKDIRAEAKKRGVPLRIVELEADENKGSKALNIDAISQPLYNGEIYIHESMRDLIGEATLWPNGLTCDLLDLLGQINKQVFKRGQKLEGPRPMMSREAFVSQPASRVGY